MLKRMAANETRNKREADEKDRPAGQDLTSIIEEGALWIQQTLDQVEQQKEGLREAMSNSSLTDKELKKLMLESLASLERNLTRELNTYLRGLSELSNGQVNRLLFGERKIKEAYQELVRRAEEKELEPINEDEAQIYNVKADMIMAEDQKVYAWIWIPFQRNLKVKLYRYLQEPLDWRGFHLYARPPRDMLALDEKQHIGREVERSELERCKTMNAITVCPNEQVYLQKIEELCLYNLWRGSGEEVQRTCGLELREEKPLITPLTAGLVRAHLPQQVDFVFTCGAEAKKLQVKNQALIPLNTTCPMAVSHDFILLSEEDHLPNGLHAQAIKIDDNTELFHDEGFLLEHFQKEWIVRILRENGGALSLGEIEKLHRDSHQAWTIFIRQLVSETVTGLVVLISVGRYFYSQQRCVSPIRCGEKDRHPAQQPGLTFAPGDNTPAGPLGSEETATTGTIPDDEE